MSQLLGLDAELLPLLCDLQPHWNRLSEPHPAHNTRPESLLCCAPPAAMNAIYFPGLSFGGSISPDWILPDSMKFLNLGRCNLSGTLPDQWLLPANITTITLSVRDCFNFVPLAILGSSQTTSHLLGLHAVAGTLPNLAARLQVTSLVRLPTHDSGILHPTALPAAQQPHGHHTQRLHCAAQPSSRGECWK